MKKMLCVVAILLSICLLPMVSSQATYENCLVIVSGDTDWVRNTNGDMMIMSYRDGDILNTWIAGTTPYRCDRMYLYLEHFVGLILKGYHRIFLIGFVDSIEVM